MKALIKLPELPACINWDEPTEKLHETLDNIHNNLHVSFSVRGYDKEEDILKIHMHAVTNEGLIIERNFRVFGSSFAPTTSWKLAIRELQNNFNIISECITQYKQYNISSGTRSVIGAEILISIKNFYNTTLRKIAEKFCALPDDGHNFQQEFEYEGE